MGRPSKRTPEREARLLEALRAGNTRQAACHYAGLEQHTFQRWVVDNAHFAQAIQKAEGDAEVKMVALVMQAAATTWQAAAWWLERRRPEHFGRPYLQPEQSADAAPVHVTVIFDRADQNEPPTIALNGHTAAH